MEQLEEFRTTVAQNLVKYRRNAGLTQLELAEKLNYSDKAVSKWERGETVPDAYVLKQLAEIYNISVDEFLSKKTEEQQKMPFIIKRAFKNKHFIITSLSTGLVWLIACICFVVLRLLDLDSIAYMSFIYAIPVSSIVCLVFSSIWSSKKWISGIFATITLWTVFLSIFLSFSSPNLWIIFIIAIPLQFLVVLWYFLIKESKKIKWHLKKIDDKSKKNKAETIENTENQAKNDNISNDNQQNNDVK